MRHVPLRVPHLDRRSPTFSPGFVPQQITGEKVGSGGELHGPPLILTLRYSRRMTINWDDLIEKASTVRQKAYAPYSDFHVGAALLDDRGVVCCGCNVENVSYGLSVCAERHAVAAAIADGSRSFRALVVITDVSPPGSPCGACRQVLAEFGDFPILLVNPGGERVETSVETLLPMAFRPEDLG